MADDGTAGYPAPSPAERPPRRGTSRAGIALVVAYQASGNPEAAQQAFDALRTVAPRSPEAAAAAGILEAPVPSP